jgi:hypothetical protein
MKLEASVSQFENNNQEYLKIRRIVEEKVRDTLSNSKVLLKYAMLSLVQSMKKDPDKFTSIIYDYIDSPTSSTQHHAAFDMYGQHQEYPSPYNYSDDCVDMLVDEAEKVYNNLAKECIEGSIDEYAASTTSSSPRLPSPDEEKGGNESDLM